MTIKMSFEAIKAEKQEEPADAVLLALTRAHNAEHPGLSLEQSFARVCDLEPALHRAYLDMNGTK